MSAVDLGSISIFSQTKKLQNWSSQLYCLTFSIKGIV